MSIFQWPFKRKTYTDVDNPRFVSDIQAANEAVIDAMTALAGLGAGDFAILSGLAYTPAANGNPGQYSPGTFYLGGSFYYTPSIVLEGYYLVGEMLDTQQAAFPGGTTRNIYTLYTAGVSAQQVTGGSPIMSGNMNTCRISNKYLSGAVQALQANLQATIAGLGNAASLNVGQVTGTVAAGDDPRLAYTQAVLDAKFAGKADADNVLLLNNTTAFTPTADYQPATKQYVDNSSAGRLLSGTCPIGDVPTAGFVRTVSLGATLSNNNYIAVVTPISQSTSGASDVVHQVLVRNKTVTGFDVYFSEPGPATQNLALDWIVFKQ